MLRRVAAVAALALLAAPAAGAKEGLKEIEVCGRSACVTAGGRAVLDAVRPYERPTAYEPPPLAPYLTIGPDDRVLLGRLFYVPDSGMLAARHRSNDEEPYVIWFRLDDRERRLLEGVARGLEPHPAPTITRVRIAGRTVEGAGAASYERLWRVRGEPVPSGAEPSRWIRLDVESDVPSPWTSERPELVYAPGANVLERGLTLIRVPDALAADLEAGRPLGASGARAWPEAIGVLALAGIGTLLRRRRRRRGTARAAV
jgi:hypothetical protein